MGCVLWPCLYYTGGAKTDENLADSSRSAPFEHMVTFEMHYERHICSFCCNSAEIQPRGEGLSTSLSVHSATTLNLRAISSDVLHRVFVFHIKSCGSHMRAAAANPIRSSLLEDVDNIQADQQKLQKAGAKPRAQAQDPSLLDCGNNHAHMLNFISADQKNQSADWKLPLFYSVNTIQRNSTYSFLLFQNHRSPHL